jgi:hypothetical protein
MNDISIARTTAAFGLGGDLRQSQRCRHRVSIVRRRLTLFERAVRRIHRAVVQALCEMNELHVGPDVGAACHQIVGVEGFRREHVAELLAESFFDRRRE